MSRPSPHADPRDPPLTVVSAASLVLDEPDAAARTLAVLAIFTVLVASGSFLGLVFEVRRTLR